jgi:late competence protein required for DNA uptake (superfamily II DNA/RNA helicase)
MNCKFEIAWIGTCNKASDKSWYCPHHQKLRCEDCGQKAEREITIGSVGKMTTSKIVCDSCRQLGRF